MKTWKIVGAKGTDLGTYEAQTIHDAFDARANLAGVTDSSSPFEGVVIEIAARQVLRDATTGRNIEEPPHADLWRRLGITATRDGAVTIAATALRDDVARSYHRKRHLLRVGVMLHRKGASDERVVDLVTAAHGLDTKFLRREIALPFQVEPVAFEERRAMALEGVRHRRRFRRAPRRQSVDRRYNHRARDAAVLRRPSSR